MRFLKEIATISIVFLLSGCADGTAIRSGAVRPATNPQNVVVYVSPPKQTYDVVGIVSSESIGWTKQESIDKGIEELKRQAAFLGANGLILNMHETEINYSANTSGTVSANGQVSTSTKITESEGAEKMKATAIFTIGLN